MRSLNVDLLPPGHEELLAIRNQLQSNLRSKKAKSKKENGIKNGAAESMEGVKHDIDFSACLALVLSTLTDTTAGSTITATARVVASVLALEVLGFLLTEARLLSTDPAMTAILQNIFNDAVLINLANLIWTAWDSGPSALLQKSKSSLTELLSLSITLSSTAAPLTLLQELVIAPLLTKRSIAIFESILVNFNCDFLVTAFGEKGCEDILNRFTLSLCESDEVAVISGRVMMKWIKKVWSEKGIEMETFWVSSVSDALRSSERGRSNIGLYLLPTLFQERKSAFKELIENGFGSVAGEDSLAGTVAILKVGNAMGLIQIGDKPPAPDAKDKDKKFIIPASLVDSCLYHSSSTIRCAALSLLTFSTTPSLPIPSLIFPLLRNFYSYSMGEEEGEFRMQSIALSGKLLLRLRDSSWKAGKKGNLAYVAEVKNFVEWWSKELQFNLNPAKPFRVRMNALRYLDMLFQSHLDSNFGPPSTIEAYSSYRTTAPTPFSARHKPQHTVGTTASATTENPNGLAWPSVIALVTPESTFTLLRLLLSTYTALRALSITLLERFPSPLPGYEGLEGAERAKVELLEPALSMVRSGRESEATAGATIISLIWKRVLEGEASWDLGEIGGWRLAGTTKKAGPVGLSFLNDLMDLADEQILAHAADLSKAASSSPMHGTLLALRHLFLAIPTGAYDSISTVDERRAVFLRALGIVERVWEVTKVVLAASAPEGSTGATDTEEARALIFTDGDVEMDAVEESDGAGSGGPKHKIILSATWRAMKEAGELLETILRLPTGLGVIGFKSIWTIDNIRHIGDLYATWLTQIRHRGALMALFPTYSRANSALLLVEWPEVKALPVEWLNIHLESIISKKISITRRSAGLPYCILSCLTAILPVEKEAFAPAFSRLLEIAESKDSEILDESRVHAMNTLRTIFLEAKSSNAVAPYIERAYLLSISLFWSNNWIIRNVAMILYGTLVTRSFGRKINLGRDNAALIQRVTAEDFFARYPSLHKVLLSELTFASREHLDDLPAIDLQSSLFSVLMILSLLQTLNRTGTTDSLSDPFIQFVRACGSSKVWKIRDVAADALTGLIPSAEVGSTCLSILRDVELCKENELHGRLVQVLRLLEASAPLSSVDNASLSTRLAELESPLLAHSFSVRTTFIHISRIFAISSQIWSPTLKEAVHSQLEASRSWTNSFGHLPSAENFVTAAFELALTFDPSSTTLLQAGIASPYLSIQRKTLSILESLSKTEKGLKIVQDSCGALLDFVVLDSETAECRIQALGVISKLELGLDIAAATSLADKLIAQYDSTVIVPLKESLLPLLGKLVAQNPTETRLEHLLNLLEIAAGVDESIESRESGATTLLQLQPAFQSVKNGTNLDRFARVLSKLVSDDDSTVRQAAAAVVVNQFSNGIEYTERKALETILDGVGPSNLSLQTIELHEDVATLNNPSSLLFAIEKPNIHFDDLHETEYLHVHPSSSLTTPEEISQVLSTLSLVIPTGSLGPLGIIGNNLICKWSYRVITRLDGMGNQEMRNSIELENKDLLQFMRKSFAL